VARLAHQVRRRRTGVLSRGQPPFSTHDYPEDKLEVLIVDGMSED